MSVYRARLGKERGGYLGISLGNKRPGATLYTSSLTSEVWHALAYAVRYIGLILCMVVFTILVVRGCLLESFYVPSSSMAPTLQVQDCIVVPKFTYGLRLPFVERPIVSWSSPARGEVVVFHREDDPQTRTDESARAIVKRIIGVGGDSVHLEGERVFVNGTLQHEPYVRREHSRTLELDSAGSFFVVPEGKVFLLGDNRDESDDSRFWRDPFVSVERVVGPATAVYWSALDSVRLVY